MGLDRAILLLTANRPSENSPSCSHTTLLAILSLQLPTDRPQHADIIVLRQALHRPRTPRHTPAGAGVRPTAHPDSLETHVGRTRFVSYDACTAIRLGPGFVRVIVDPDLDLRAAVDSSDSLPRKSASIATPTLTPGLDQAAAVYPAS